MHVRQGWLLHLILGSALLQRSVSQDYDFRDPEDDDDSLDAYILHAYKYEVEDDDYLDPSLDDYSENSPLEFVYDRRFPTRFLPIDLRGRFDLLNPDLSPEGLPFVEGDMVFAGPPDAGHLDVDEGRKMVSGDKYLWPPHPSTGYPFVPYVIDRSAKKIRDLLEDAVWTWANETCITFKEVKSDFLGPHIRFVRSRGCWSYVGRQYYNKDGQKLSIGLGCTKRGIILHELGHSLGLIHEHSRTDRDRFIRIVWSNILKKSQRNFLVWEDTRFDDVPYDYSSVMHYGFNFFSKGRSTTIIPKDPFQQHLLGQRKRLSFRDIAVANSVYGCVRRWEALCNDVTSKCKNGGYLWKNCKCVCPPGTAGDTCANKVGSYYPEIKCGGNVTSAQNITSPDFPQRFPPNTWCLWWVQAGECHRVKLTINAFMLLHNVRGICHWDTFELRLRSPLDPGSLYCGRDLRPGDEFLSKGRDMFIVFHGKYRYAPGFSASIDFVDGRRTPSGACVEEEGDDFLENQVQSHLN